MNTATSTPTTPPRSTFVTVLAWLGIVLAGFATLIGTAQIFIVRTMFRDPAMAAVIHDSLATAPIPELAKALFGHIQYVFLFTFLFAAAALAASIGLLHRRNWARLAFVGLLTLGICWNLFSLVIQQAMMSSMQVPLSQPGASVPDFATMFRFMRVFMIVIALGLSVLFAWLISRLVSRPVKAEFAARVA